MKRYKPNYLGKVIPVDNPSKMANFLNNNYDQFSKIYDVCKDCSDSIKDVQLIDKEDTSLNIKITTGMETLNNIQENIKDDSISIQNDVITAKK